MSEAEYNLLLDAVRTAVAPVPEDGIVTCACMPGSMTTPQAANDNDGAWPLLPFPDGWHAAC